MVTVHKKQCGCKKYSFSSPAGVVTQETILVPKQMLVFILFVGIQGCC